MAVWWNTSKSIETSSQQSGDTFLSLAVHELRSPLSIIKWYTEMLLDGDAGTLTADQIKYLTTIEVSNQRAIDLIRSLLNVSRLELGTFCIKPELQDLSQLITQVVGEYKDRAQQKNIVLHADSIITGLSLNLDKQMMLVILRNLLSNAVAFSKDGGHIEVSSKVYNKADTVESHVVLEDSIVITISDNGIGIPEEDKPSVYHKLFKGSNVTDSDSTGSGFGLYIVKTVLLHSGGDIWFISEKDKGTTFFVSLPISGMNPKDGRTSLD